MFAGPTGQRAPTSQMCQGAEKGYVQLGETADFSREVRHTERDGRPAWRRGDRLRTAVRHLIVDPRRRCGSGARKPIYGDPLEDCSSKDGRGLSEEQELAAADDRERTHLRRRSRDTCPSTRQAFRISMRGVRQGSLRARIPAFVGECIAG